jgi:tetratricopeptide (TPR) repeat protein
VGLLAQAVAAYRSALEVYTRDTFPQDWATTQNNLGNALRDQAGRTSGQAGADLLAQAVAAYRSALEVRTRATLPQDWATTQNNLAKALVATGDSLGAARATEGVLELYPDQEEALLRLASLYEDRLFDYDRALPLFQKLVAMNRTVGNLENLAESLLQNGRFADCEKAWTALTKEILSPNHLPLRDTFRLACQSAAGDSTAARATAAGLASATLEPTKWGFNGTLHFLSTNAAFADHRDAWVGLFTALDKADTSAFRAALQEIQASLNSR